MLETSHVGYSLNSLKGVYSEKQVTTTGVYSPCGFRQGCHAVESHLVKRMTSSVHSSWPQLGSSVTYIIEVSRRCHKKKWTMKATCQVAMAKTYLILRRDARVSPVFPSSEPDLFLSATTPHNPMPLVESRNISNDFQPRAHEPAPDEASGILKSPLLFRAPAYPIGQFVNRAALKFGFQDYSHKR